MEIAIGICIAVVLLIAAVVALIAAFIVVVAMQPSDFRIVRSTTISGPPSDIFAQVNDLHKWEAWSPWAKLDHTLKQSYEGAPSGTGAIYGWNGNKRVGEGRMSITESRPNDLIRIKLEFMRPFAGTNDVEFSFKPEGDQTVVTWTMTGKYSFIPKAVGLFMNMEKMLGGMFEQGLAQMKAVVEAKKAPVTLIE